MADRGRNAEPTFWMNVTTSANWKRPAVGVVRVEQELKKHLRERLGGRFKTLVLKEGKFVLEGRGASHLSEVGEFWPDPSYGSSGDPFDLLQPASVNAEGAKVSAPSGPGFRPGDILISVGLDWDHAGLHPEIRRLARIYDLTVITCCYDLIPVLFPHYCVGDVAAWFKGYMIDMTWNSDAVLCISENTRRDYLDLCEAMGLPIRQTEVIRLGSSLPTDLIDEEPSKEVSEILDSKFFLFVSTIERRKNHEVLYRAYRLIREQQPELDLPKLVFVGMEGWGVDGLMSDIRLDPLTKDDIVILPHVTDAELTSLYSKCDAFLYPSLYEGWGLPVAEALQLGRPVLAANTGSIPEVGGDLVRYIDPWAPRDWADELLDVVSGKTDLAAWSERIRAEFQPFEWTAAADTVLRLAKELRSKKPEVRVFQAGYDLSTLHGVHYGGKIVYSGKRGIVCFGPYIALAEGIYEMRLKIDWLDVAPGVLRFKALYNKGEARLGNRNMSTGSLDPGRHDVVLRVKVPELVDDFEFVCEVECSDEIRISVDGLEITRVDETPEIASSTRAESNA